MKTQSRNTALLVFARTSAYDATQKQWASHKAKSIELSRFLNKKTEQLATQSRLPVVFVNEAHQIGNTFGEKLANAFQLVYDEGYEHVIAIGNDCPELTVKQLQSAEQQLKKGKAVLGPDFRNGAYLIGVAHKDFEIEKFSQLRWQSKYTFSDLNDFLSNAFILERHIDLNEQADLQLLRSANVGQRLIDFIAHCFGLFVEFLTTPKFGFASKICLQYFGLRAPPTLQ